ncbi:MAG TPA: hypothetical protein VLJ60_02475 [bacterium]|nr:hypothetical protein [bacterium]
MNKEIYKPDVIKPWSKVMMSWSSVIDPWRSVIIVWATVIIFLDFFPLPC